jgi:preprotein translocase subunit SecG
MSELIYTPLVVIHVIACLFLMLVVLIQPGKSGGMGAFTGAAATQVFGGGGATNILTKITWVIAGVFFVTNTSLAYLSSSSDESLRAKAAKQEKSGDKPADKPPPAKPPAKK